MLDQPFLSFKAPNSSAPATNEQAVADAEVNTAQTDNAPVEQRFSDVLKETETKMRTTGPSAGNNTETKSLLGPVNNEDMIVIDHSLLTANGPIEFITPEVKRGNLNFLSGDDPDIDLAVAVDDSLLNTVNVVNLVDVVDGKLLSDIDPESKGIAKTSELTSTIITPVQSQAVTLNTTSSETNQKITLSRSGVDVQPVITSLATPLAEGEEFINTQLNLSKTPLANAMVSNNPLASFIASANQSNTQFLQQISKAFSDQIVAETDTGFDVDTLKSLGLLSNATTTSPVLSTDTTKAPISVTIPFQQAQWGAAVAEKVMWMSSHGLQEAQIQMDPPELGPLQVKVTVENDQAHVSFVVQHANVKEALEQTAVRLREMFEAEGIDLVDVDVSDQSAQEQESELAEQDNSENTQTQADENTPETAGQVITSLMTDTGGIDAYV